MSPTRQKSSVGHWCAFVCGPSAGWDRTALGVVVYAADGNLAFSRWAGADKAKQRGDWKDEWPTLSFNPPATWEEMEKRLASTGNAMSTVRWEGGNPTLSWDDGINEALYRNVVNGAVA